MGVYTLTNEAENDIDEIVDYIYEQNPRSALSLAREIHYICSLVGDMPLMGHVVEGIGSGQLLHLPAGKYSHYLIFYIITDKVPMVVRVIHSKHSIVDTQNFSTTKQKNIPLLFNSINCFFF